MFASLPLCSLAALVLGFAIPNGFAAPLPSTFDHPPQGVQANLLMLERDVVIESRERIPLAGELVMPGRFQYTEYAVVNRSASGVQSAEAQIDTTHIQSGRQSFRFMLGDLPAGARIYELHDLTQDGEYRSAEIYGRAFNPFASDRQYQLDHLYVRFNVRDFTPVQIVQRLHIGERRDDDSVISVTLLDLVDGRLTGRREALEMSGGSRDVDMELGAGTLVSGMEHYVLAAADLSVGWSVTIPILELNGYQVQEQTFEVTRREEVTVPAGTFDTYRVEVRGQPLVYFLRRSAPHFPIMIKLVGHGPIMELHAME